MSALQDKNDLDRLRTGVESIRRFLANADCGSSTAALNELRRRIDLLPAAPAVAEKPVVVSTKTTEPIRTALRVIWVGGYKLNRVGSALHENHKPGWLLVRPATMEVLWRRGWVELDGDGYLSLTVTGQRIRRSN